MTGVVGMRVLVAVSAVLLVAGATGPAAGGGFGPESVDMVAGDAPLPFDFNADGHVDLAVGVPGEDVGRRVDAGAVQVILGSASGPTTAGDQVWHQNRPGVRGVAERGDRFGAALASGDFDSDGFADLAIGVPGESIRGRRAGAVHVLYGSPRGLTAAGDQVWHQNTRGVPGGNQSGDQFGATLAAGDFDADGDADLAIGVPGEDHHGYRSAGRVLVLLGSARGLTTSGAQLWDESSAGIAGDPASMDRFGAVLAAGDVDDDGRDDLAIATGVARDSSALRRGIHVLRGSATGLTAAGAQFLVDAPELTRSCVEDDCTVPFGDLVLADFNDDGRSDLGHAVIPGRVVVRYARDAGFGSAPTSAIDVAPGTDQSWTIGPDDGLRQEAGPRDLLGAALAAGDLTGDGIADLAIGAPGWDGDSVGVGVGLVFVVPGSRTVMPSSVGARGAGDVPGDAFGASLAILPLGGSTPGWLAVGIPGDTVAGRVGAGSVLVCPGEATPYEGRCATWSQATPGIRGTAERGDGFGAVLPG